MYVVSLSCQLMTWEYFQEEMYIKIILLFRWRSSLWKILWKELLAYTLVFLFVSLIYRVALTEDMQIQFEMLIRWCGKMYTGQTQAQINGYISSFLFQVFLLPSCLVSMCLLWLRDGGSSTASYPGQTVLHSS